MTVANSVPRSIADSLIGMAQVITANPNRDGTGTLGTVVTGGAEGTLVELVRVVAAVTTTAGMVRLFIEGGGATRLIKEIPVSAVTASATVEAFSAEWIPTKPLSLPSGYILKAGTEKAEAINVFATGGSY